jgi:hypothetical protein
MQKRLFYLLFTINSLLTLGHITSPSKVAIWRNDEVHKKSDHYSKFLDSNDLLNIVSDYIMNADYFIFLKNSKSTSLFSDSNIVHSIQSASDSMMFPNVYKRDSEKLESKISNLPCFRDSETKTLSELYEILNVKERKNSDSESVRGITAICDDSNDYLKQINELNLKLAFICVSESSEVPKVPDIDGNYYRLLSASNSTSNSTNIYYKPEGTEYSIYYASKYLYITPDIFTGLITGIFFALVLYTGLNCLSSIQTPSTFSSKNPAVGREN